MSDGLIAAATEGGEVTNQWIVGLPVDAGWYWVCTRAGTSLKIVQLVWAAADANTVRPALRANGYNPAVDDQWFGPLDPPSPPLASSS